MLRLTAIRTRRLRHSGRSHLRPDGPGATVRHSPSCQNSLLHLMSYSYTRGLCLLKHDSQHRVWSIGCHGPIPARQFVTGGPTTPWAGEVGRHFLGGVVAANPTTSRAAAREMSGQTLGITSTACMVPITTTQRADTPAARSVR